MEPSNESIIAFVVESAVAVEANRQIILDIHRMYVVGASEYSSNSHSESFLTGLA
jgi:hypothetical protein